MRVSVRRGRWPEAPGSSALPPGQILPEAWARHWASAPERPVLLEGRDRSGHVVGASLDEVTRQVAGTLLARAVAPGERVLWGASARVPSVEVLLGIVRAGAVLVPVNPASTAAELAHVVEDASPVAAVLDVPPADGLVGVETYRVDELLAESAGAASAAARLPALRADDDALIVYTSGTTGKPKGAVHTHGSLASGVGALHRAWEWESDDQLILALPLYHVHGLCAGLFGALAAGSSVVVFERFDEVSVLQAAPSSTLFFGVPTMYHRLAASGRAEELAQLRLCVSGSAALAPDLWARLHGDGVSVLERYGMSETLLTLSNPLRGERRPGSVGVPLPGVDAAIDDPDEDGVGELLVRGPALCRGYWGRAGEETDAAGWFATGDLASVSDDGYVRIEGRRTDLIVTGGHNVYPAEVEAVLGRHPGVSEVAVVGLPSAEWGETVVAFVVGDPDSDSLVALAARELAPHKRPRELPLWTHCLATRWARWCGQPYAKDREEAASLG